MSVTDVFLLIFISLLVIYSIYDEFIMNRMKGETLLKIYLKRKNKLDCLIFVGLIAILLYNNITLNGTSFTSYLLISTALMAVYISYIRWPKLLFKRTGFFYANTFILYSRIKNMNLSEDGVLVIRLEQRRLLIHVTHLDDLENVYRFFVESQ